MIQGWTIKNFSTAAAVVVLILGISFFGYARASLSGIQKNQSAEVLASFTGFDPQSTITGKITDTSKKQVTVSSIADEKGRAVLKHPEASASPVAYHFSVEDGTRNIGIELRYNPETDSVSLKGEGAGSFARLVIDTPTGQVESRSDWAGLFEETGLRLNKDTQAQPFQIALYGAVVDDARTQMSPYIIQVQGTFSTIVGPIYHTNIYNNYLQPLRLMATEATMVAWQQILAIGMFIDAKEQLEAQRVLQTLKAEAVKDYHPSEQLCRFGSFTRSLASTEAKMNIDKRGLNKTLMAYYTNEQGASSQTGAASASDSNIDQYRRSNCDTTDNNGGLQSLCDHNQDGTLAAGGSGAAQSRRMNADINYQGLIEGAYTLDVDFTDGANSGDEEDVLALAKNLYWTTPFSEAQDLKAFDPTAGYDPELDRTFRYMQARRMMAMANLAHNSFTSIVALKAKAPAPAAGGTGNPGWAHMKTMMREFGLSDAEIEQLVGQNPSYYAQMDVMTKKIYSSPNFYTNLYDKPANVDRIKASLEAIKLMQMRDFYNSYLRREMLVSANLEESLIDMALREKGRQHDLQRKEAERP